MANTFITSGMATWSATHVYVYIWTADTMLLHERSSLLNQRDCVFVYLCCVRVFVCAQPAHAYTCSVFAVGNLLLAQILPEQPLFSAVAPPWDHIAFTSQIFRCSLFLSLSLGRWYIWGHRHGRERVLFFIIVVVYRQQWPMKKLHFIIASDAVLFLFNSFSRNWFKLHTSIYFLEMLLDLLW